ncbi:aldehyde dehydrogenase family protein [Rhizobium sp. NPDC090279]|uniref:aldehyde dehydrogenase family protein n=1 Tax=Rhizobium sp. NPDC090279 TaxID=3364499 RepID=UPI00383A4D3B
MFRKNGGGKSPALSTTIFREYRQAFLPRSHCSRRCFWSCLHPNSLGCSPSFDELDVFPILVQAFDDGFENFASLLSANMTTAAGGARNMDKNLSFYIDGEWVSPRGGRTHDVVNPATEEVIARISLGCEEDVDTAVAAARKAFASFSTLSVVNHLELLRSLTTIYARRQFELAEAITSEMGSPIEWSRTAQAPAGYDHLVEAIKVLESTDFTTRLGNALIVQEPIGVCALITPWNWPANQVMAKLAPALAVGCTVVLKPSEMAPLSAMLIADMVHEAGFPAGVFNLVNGDGAIVGSALSKHPDIDMVSFTGSTDAGIAVAQNAAVTVKRVCQELGGKSPNIILDGEDFAEAVAKGARRCFNNTGQTCTAPTRMLVPASRLQEAARIAADVADALIVGDPLSSQTQIGPLANASQYSKVRRLIDLGVEEGAMLVTGGSTHPVDTKVGYFVRPTVFAGVSPDMTIAREEIFGPVLSIIAYADEDHAVQIANNTVFGLSAAVSCSDADRAEKVARRIRAGMVHINGAGLDTGAPFGGYKQSGNGREQGRYGFEEYLETKAIFGHS